MKENPVDHVRDILVQEIMNIESSEFEKEAIDMDAISFASKFELLTLFFKKTFFSPKQLYYFGTRNNAEQQKSSFIKSKSSLKES